MHFSVVKEGDQPFLHILFNKGEKIWAEAGAMMFMSANIDIRTRAEKNLPSSSRGDSIALEKLRKAQFVCLGDDGEIAFSPPSPGSILKLELDNQRIYCDGLSFLASTKDFEFKTQGSLKTLLTGASMFLQSITGTGTVFLKCYGNLYERELEKGESIIVDTGHLVAYEETVRYKLQKPKDQQLARSAGEWLVCKYTGPGKLWLQTRNRAELAKVVQRYLP